MKINPENHFYKHRKEIDKISREQGKDVGVATDIWAAENNCRNHPDRAEWDRMVTHYQQGGRSLLDLFR